MFNKCGIAALIGFFFVKSCSLALAQSYLYEGQMLIIKTIASIWLRKYARIFVLGHYLFLEAHSSVRFLEQIMSVDKYPSIFSCQMKAIVYLYHNG